MTGEMILAAFFAMAGVAIVLTPPDTPSTLARWYWLGICTFLAGRCWWRLLGLEQATVTGAVTSILYLIAVAAFTDTIWNTVKSLYLSRRVR